MTHKKVPGADWVYMVYDNLDRLVMTRDGEQRKTNKWAFTKYDAMSRPVMTGLYSPTATLDGDRYERVDQHPAFFESYDGAAPTRIHQHRVCFPVICGGQLRRAHRDLLRQL